MLEVLDLSYAVGKKAILRHVSAQFSPGKLSMVIGPNGSGKTTLLRLLSNELRMTAGSVLYHNSLSNPNNRLEMARVRAVLAQHSELSFPLKVEEVVLMGRYPHFAVKPSRHDVEICRAALELVEIRHLAGQNYLTLSGGERQMVHFARVLAQIWEKKNGSCRFLILDEPVNSLDINHQHRFLAIVQSFVREGDVVIAVVHDLQLVAQYADVVVALKEGRVLAAGGTHEVITPAILETLFRIKSTIVEADARRIPVFLPR